MTAEQNQRVPPSTQESSPFDLQLAVCTTEGQISSNTMRLAGGQLLGGRYRIERELGQGGMGVVYLAAVQSTRSLEAYRLPLQAHHLTPSNLTGVPA